MKYKEENFLQGQGSVLAEEVEIGDLVCLANGNYFYVDDIDAFFLNDEVAEKYSDEDENIPPEDSIYSFYDLENNKIDKIPGLAKLVVYRRFEGKHNPEKT